MPSFTTRTLCALSLCLGITSVSLAENVGLIYKSATLDLSVLITEELYEIQGQSVTLTVEFIEDGGLPTSGNEPIVIELESPDANGVWTVTETLEVFPTGTTSVTETNVSADRVRGVVRLESNVSSSDAVVIETTLSAATTSSYPDYANSPGAGTNSGPAQVQRISGLDRTDMDDRFEFRNVSQGWIIQSITLAFNDESTYSILVDGDAAQEVGPRDATVDGWALGHTPASTALGSSESIDSAVATLTLIPADRDGEPLTRVVTAAASDGPWTRLSIVVSDLEDPYVEETPAPYQP